MREEFEREQATIKQTVWKIKKGKSCKQHVRTDEGD